MALGLCGALLGGATIASQRSASAMEAAANKFLAGLTPEQRAQAAMPFEDRLKWHFIPNEMFPRKGLMIKAMSEPQRKLAHDLLRAGLSQRGYMTATSIMELEVILKALEKDGKLARDHEEYLFRVYGTPAAKGSWAWSAEGHHISLHFTVVDGAATASTPAFLGSNPAEVRDGPKKGLRVLGPEEDAGRALLMALDESQRATAVIQAAALNEIVTSNKVDITPLSPSGIAAAAMTPAQRDLLMKLVDVYAGYMADDLAAERLGKIRKAGVEKIAFAWAGEAERGKNHYYRVQGPTFLIEYDNAQNDGNHVHSVWRDFDGDFGRDLLREHLKQIPH
jgi:hypothetical protein